MLIRTAAPLRWFALAIAAGAEMAAGPAGAGNCKVQNASAPGAYKFVRVHDADSGAVVLRKAINGGDSVELTVSGGRVRIEFKQPGQKDYRSGPVAICRDGNTLRVSKPSLSAK